MLEPGREPRASTLSMSINPKKPTKTGYYLALTFGTLLSSQGADAHDTRPAGLRSRRLFYVTPLPVSVKWRVLDPGSTLGVAVPGTTGDPRVVFPGPVQLLGR